MNALMHKMAAIEATGILGIDLSWLNANYQRAMFHYVRKCTADRLRELAGPRRLATLTCFLRQSYRDTIDQAVDMFDKIIIRMQADTVRELDEQMCQQRKTIKVALSGILTRTSSSLLLPVRASGTFCRITKRSSTARFFQFLPLYECRCRNIMFYRRRPLLKT